jgi:hypothetical protein
MRNRNRAGSGEITTCLCSRMDAFLQRARLKRYRSARTRVLLKAFFATLCRKKLRCRFFAPRAREQKHKDPGHSSMLVNKKAPHPVTELMQLLDWPLSVKKLHEADTTSMMPDTQSGFPIFHRYHVRDSLPARCAITLVAHTFRFGQ